MFHTFAFATYVSLAFLTIKMLPERIRRKNDVGVVQLALEGRTCVRRTSVHRLNCSNGAFLILKNAGLAQATNTNV